jgi:trigger factor
MEVQIKDRQAVEATVEVALAATEVDAAFDSVMKQLAGQVRIPGFRPGKVPPAMLIKRIGEEAILQEVRDQLMEENFRPALEQVELAPLEFHFHGDQPQRGEPFTFTIHAELAPEIVLPDLDEIIMDTAASEISDEQVEATVRRMQRENSTLVPVDRPAQPTDVVLIETISDTDSDEPGSTMPIEMDTVGEEFAEQLLGHQAGDEVELVFNPGSPAADTAADEEDEEPAAEPEDLEGLDEAAQLDGGEEAAPGEAETGTAEAAAEPTRIKVRIVDVKERDLPPADDEFARTLGLESWEETLDLIRNTLQEQLDSETFEEQKTEFIDKLLAGNEFEVPRSMINRRQRFLLSNLEEDLRRRNASVEAYVSDLEEKGQREEFEQDLLNSAAASVRRDLVLEKLMLDRQVELTDEEFSAALDDIARQEGVSVRALRRERGEEWLENLRYVLGRDKALEEAVRERVAAAAVAAIE